jgi:pimeloyl-ACP methyl ester carboxylesterase
MPVLERDGLPLAYAVAGAGPPFIFQHGLGGDAGQPASQAPKRFTVITLECRGHGGSPLGPAEALGFRTYARDLAALLDELALPRTFLGGISMGAGVALALARQHPQRVRALVLIRPAWMDRPSPPNLRVYAEIARLLRCHEAHAAKALFVTQSDEYQRIQRISPAHAASLVTQFDHRDPTARAAVLERLPADVPMRESDLWSDLTIPVLVVGTRHDPVHPFAYAVETSHRLPNAVLREAPSKEQGEATHRRAVASLIRDFLSDLGLD